MGFHRKEMKNKRSSCSFRNIYCFNKKQHIGYHLLLQPMNSPGSWGLGRALNRSGSGSGGMIYLLNLMP